MEDTTSPIILAFSGGLDTSMCVPWLAERHQRPVITVTVNTGGLSDDDARRLQERSRQLGAAEHLLVEAREDFFNEIIRHLIFGNVRRGQLYPLCVGAERGIQASRLAQAARRFGSSTVAHGCTAAGNDQVRFEVALKTLDPGLVILAPVRDEAFVRSEQVKFLEQRNMPVPSKSSAYSINRGLWGVTIGGTETLTSTGSIPEDAWVLSAGAFEANRAPRKLSIGFDKGVPISLDGERLQPVALIERVEQIGADFAIGRGIHLGDTILGTKGRVAFEAPAAEILISAHRELEKLVLSPLQMRVKDQVAATYGDLIHEGKQLDLVCRDIEALLGSSQRRVTGEAHLLLRPGSVFVEGVSSAHSLLKATRGVYGESAGEWTPADALGYSRVLSLPGILQTRAGNTSA